MALLLIENIYMPSIVSRLACNLPILQRLISLKIKLLLNLARSSTWPWFATTEEKSIKTGLAGLYTQEWLF